MAEVRDPGEMQVAIVVLRTVRGWDQSDLAAAAGVAPSSISRYESGEIQPSRRTFERLVAAVGLPLYLVDRLFGWIRSARTAVAGSAADAEGIIDALCREASEGVSHAFRSAAALVLASQPGSGAGVPGRKPSSPSPEDRKKALGLWEAMKRRDSWGRQILVEDAQEFRSWALCELVCAESEKAAADDAGRAEELAELAVRIAGLAPGEETWRWRLQGYAAAHLGNARRVRTDWPGAEEAFRRAARLWEAGAPGDPGLLSEAQILSLEASLRTDQDRLPEATALLHRALAANPGALRPSLLIKRARVLEWAGDYESALATLRQVGPLPPDRQEPRLLWILRLNAALLLCHLGRFTEAEALLPEVRALTTQLGNKLDTLRLHWLEGRVGAGLGRAAEAVEAFTQARAGFAAEGIAYDAALVTLELAVLHLEQGRTREVKTLARQMAPIFRAQGVHQAALAALKLFCDAVERETITVELARRVVEYLYRAQHQPELRFEAGE